MYAKNRIHYDPNMLHYGFIVENKHMHKTSPSSPTPSVLVLGDCFEDVYWVGRASRVSPEAPVLVVTCDASEPLWFPGGAANVASNLQDLGVLTVLLRPPGTLPTKHRLLVGTQQIVRWDVNDYCLPISLAGFRSALTPIPSAIVVSDYSKGSITSELVSMVAQQHLPTFVDTKASPAPWLGVATVVFPNLAEYEDYQEDYDEFELVVLKQGQRGAALLHKGHVVAAEPSHATSVVSVCGAGDTVLAAFVSKYLEFPVPPNYPQLRECLGYAMRAAGIVCSKPYTATVSKSELCK